MSKSSHAPQIPKELTRKHLARAERDARYTRVLVLGVGAAVVLAVVLVLFGLLREAVLLPNEPVARVGDQTISTREFQQRVRWERYRLIRQLAFYQSITGLEQNAAQIEEQLNDPVGLGSQVIDLMVDEAVYRLAAPALGVSVSPDEVQKTIEESFDYYRVPPTPAPTATASPSQTPAPTPTAAAAVTATAIPRPTTTPFPTATPVSVDAFQQMFQDQLGEMATLGFSEADYRRLVETQLIAAQVQDIVTRDTPTMTEQVEFQYIFSSSPENMDMVKQAIGTDGFDTVYGQALSQTFPITTLVANDVSFVPKSDLADSPQFGPAFADVVFTAPISGTFGVISNTGGSLYFMGRVLNREVRELSPSGLQSAQSKALQDWLNDQRIKLVVEVFTWDDRVPADPSVSNLAPVSQ